MANKTVFITGATAGFGAATARRFAREGANLVLLGRRRERLDALEDELDVPVHGLAVDIRDRQALTDGIGSLPDDFKAIDILINNAGLALGLDMADSADIDDWEVMVDTNIKGLLYTTHAVLPGMVARGRGHIVNLGSVAGTYPYPGGNVYGGTKAFVNLFSLELRADLLGKGIRVTSVEPGLCETEFSTVRFKGDTDKAKAIYANTVALTADDIAESIYWATSLPSYFNVNRMELMPISQAFNPFAIKRDK